MRRGDYLSPHTLLLRNTNQKRSRHGRAVKTLELCTIVFKIDGLGMRAIFYRVDDLPAP